MAGEKLQGQGKRKCQPKCAEHQFNLHPKNTKCWLKSPTNIDFCPLYNDALACFENIVPVFNYDEQQCLPGFILEVDRNDYQKSMQKYKEDHQRKIQEYTMKKTKLQIPKPGRKHRYCGVCRKPYVDYLDHIQSPDHINCFNRHEFVNVINKIIEDDYRSRDENKISNDSSTYPSKAIMPKKRGPKPKIINETTEPKKRGRKPNNPETNTLKRRQTQPIQELYVQVPVRSQQPPPNPFFTQPFFFQYHALNHMLPFTGNPQIPTQFCVPYHYQVPLVGQEIKVDMRVEDMIVDGQIDDRPQFD